MKIAVVVGMASEKPIVGERPGIQVIVGAGMPSRWRHASKPPSPLALIGLFRLASAALLPRNCRSAISSSACQFAIVAIPSSIAMMRGRLGSSEH